MNGGSTFRTIAEHTGGRSLTIGPDFQPGINQLLLENSSYYLMAYSPTNAEEDGRFRRISVQVRGRPDLEVRTRQNYWAPKARTSGDATAVEPPPEVAALAGIMPLSDLRLRGTAVAFADFNGTGVVVPIVLGVQQPAFANRTAETVDLLVRAFTADGDERGSATQTISINVPASFGGDVTRYEVLARIDLPKPGRYELRVSAYSEVSDARGSLYLDVDVPDFSRDKLSMSGVVLNNAVSAIPVAPSRLFRDVVPVVPTSERAFRDTDAVTAFMRLYQGGNDRLSDVNMRVTIQNAAGRAVFATTDTISAGEFASDRAAAYQFRPALDKFQAGEYLLTFEAAVGKNTVRRDVKFQKR